MARQALGRGLGALIPGHLQDLDPSDRASITEVAVAEVKPNPWQPRTVFKPEDLRQLADSIREQGVLQPILVVREKKGYTLVSGERRLRAVQLLGLPRIPAVVRDTVSKQEMAEWAIIENVQRADLNPLEESRAYKRLVDEFNLSQEDVAKKVGKDRATVANSLRLLRLPKDVQKMMEDGDLQMGHARALLSLERPEAIKALAVKASREGWSVRMVERAVADRAGAGKGAKKPRRRSGVSAEVGALEDKLRKALGTKVKLFPVGKGGRIEISYYSEEEFERLLDLLTGR